MSTLQKPFPGIGMGFLCLLLLWFVNGLFSLLAFIPGIPKDLGTFLGYVLGFGAFLGIIMLIKKQKGFEFRPTQPLVYYLIIPITAAMAFVNMFLTSLIPMPESFAQLMSELIDGGPLIFIMVAIMAPLLEEFIFRGVLLDSFLKRSSPATAIIVSAVIFGLAHLNPWQFIVAFNMGLVAGWLYYRTRSILPGIAIHFINNAGVSLLFNDSAPAENIIGELGTGLTVILLLASGAILLTSFVYLREKLPAAGQWKEEEVELPFSDTYKGVLDT